MGLLQECPLILAHSVHGDHRVRKFTWGLLREVVPDSTGDYPVLIRSSEHRSIGVGRWVGSPVGVAFEGDGRHGDTGPFGQTLLDLVVFGLALREP